MTLWPLFLRVARIDGTAEFRHSSEANAAACLLATRPWLLPVWWAAKWISRK